jgi:DNA-binding Lrp family transcriptional regulator
VIAGLRRLIDDGVIKRFGVIVRHRELGYRANAMVVWDVPEERVSEAGRKLADLPFVTLCYRRPRRLPVWPYNLFCMIHGRERGAVEALVETASAAAGLNGLTRAVLFSRRRFKQRGARYVPGRLEVA